MWFIVSPVRCPVNGKILWTVWTGPDPGPDPGPESTYEAQFCTAMGHFPVLVQGIGIENFQI